MDHIVFDWDDIKNKKNVLKHKVSFEEAKTAFLDPNALLIFDPDHSEDEERFILMGMSQNLNLLVVCHCYKSNDEVIRIISCSPPADNTTTGQSRLPSPDKRNCRITTYGNSRKRLTRIPVFA